MYPSPSSSYVPVPSGATQPAPPLNNPATPSSAASPTSMSVWQGDAAQIAQASRNLKKQQHDLVHGLEFGSENLALEFLVDIPAQRIPRMQTGINGAQDSAQFHHIPMKHDWTIPWSQLASQPSLQYPSAQGETRYPAEGSIGSEGSVVWSAPVQNCPASNPLDSLMMDFLTERRQRAAEGVPQQEITGPRYPSVSSLLNPSKSLYAHPMSKVFTDILTTFPDLSTLPERVAVLYLMFLFMRWQVYPSRENYLRIPGFFRPRPSQLSQSHPAWIDHLPFPAMREFLVTKYGPRAQDEFPFENFFIPFTTTLSLNWPYEDTDALLQGPDGEELMINPVFERHLGRLENWTLGDAFHQTFPELAGTYNLRSSSPREPTRDGGDTVAL